MKHLIFLAEKIEQADLAQIGVDLFISTLPSDVPHGVMLIDPLIGHTIDGGLRGFFASEVQMIVRDPDTLAGYDKALAISKVLTMADVYDQDVHISWCYPATLPISYPRGDADDIETSVRFHLGFGLRDS